MTYKKSLLCGILVFEREGEFVGVGGELWSFLDESYSVEESMTLWFTVAIELSTHHYFTA